MRNLEWLSRWFTLNKLAIPLTSPYLINLDYSDPLVSDIEITKSPLYSFSFSPIFATSNLFYYKSHRPKTTWRSWKVCLTVVTTSLKSRYQILRGVLCCGPDIVDHCWISIKRFNNPDGRTRPTPQNKPSFSDCLSCCNLLSAFSPIHNSLADAKVFRIPRKCDRARQKYFKLVFE